MTFQEIRLLHFLKTVQLKEMNYIDLDYENRTATTINTVSNDEVSKSFQKYFDSVSPTLDSLARLKYVELLNQNNYHTVRVTHEGWHILQSWMFQILKFVICSILIPALVSWITARLTIS